MAPSFANETPAVEAASASALELLGVNALQLHQGVLVKKSRCLHGIAVGQFKVSSSLVTVSSFLLRLDIILRRGGQDVRALIRSLKNRIIGFTESAEELTLRLTELQTRALHAREDAVFAELSIDLARLDVGVAALTKHVAELELALVELAAQAELQ